MKLGAKNGTKGQRKIQDRAGIGPLALRPQALSLYWAFCCGDENENMGPATVVSIEGPLECKSCWYDGYDAIVDRFREALADETTGTVILRINSPGGECAGCFDAVSKMRELAAKSGKRIVAVADEAAYSAAYAIACVADEIYLSRSAGVGSVGVIAVLADCVGLNEMMGLNVVVVTAGDRKADGHPDVPLSDEAVASAQEDVDTLAGLFYDLVSSARGIPAASVEALQAATFMGDAALDAGLADGVMTFDEVVTMIAADDSNPVAAATSNEEASAMNKKSKGKKAIKGTAAELGATDAFSNPQVAAPTPAALNAISSMLGGPSAPTAVKPAAASSDDETTESETVTTETVEKDGTTTTTTESTETTVTPGADDDGDGDGESDDNEDEEDDNGGGDKKDAAIAPLRPLAAKATSGDVLAYVRDITGASTPGAQLGALHALAEKAASAEKATKRAEKARAETKKQKHAAKVDSAIRSGKLAPAKRAWALSQTTETLDGYLATSEGTPIVRTQPTPQGKVTKSLPSTDLDAAIATVAAACHVDVGAVKKHADELISKGVITH